MCFDLICFVLERESVLSQFFYIVLCSSLLHFFYVTPGANPDQARNEKGRG